MELCLINVYVSNFIVSWQRTDIQLVRIIERDSSITGYSHRLKISVLILL